MDDGRLRAVLTAVDRGSFSKAAAELGYTQSAMTHLVNNIEAELGCTLLRRGSHGVTLSEEGEKLLPYIKGVLSACDALKVTASELGKTQAQQLNIGCFASIARSELPALLHRFGEKYPDIKVNVLVRGFEMPKLLEKGEVQLAFVDETCAEGFDWTPLRKVPLVAVVPPDFKWDKDTISLSKLLESPFISCPEQYIEKLLPQETKRIQVTATDDGAILSMVAGGLGVSVLSSLSLAGYEGMVRTIELADPIVVRMGVAVKSSASQSSTVRRFARFVKSCYPDEA